ncbi:MAG TPA: D-aminoacylase [Candidatus Brachybacterium merdigallinarum]|nr:D-aminoacylase [Candidatus Brachybacterium merdigallinarum]
MTEPDHDYSVVITNATILDGTGASARHGSVAVSAGRIAAISFSSSAPVQWRAETLIDAENQVLSPGFIDLHSHADFTLPAAPGAITQITQGVTTIMTGNCGSSPFPIGELEPLQDATSIFAPQLSWDWSDAAGYATRLRDAAPAVNVALQVGHGALRIAAMGDDDRAPTPDELERMCELLETAAEQGVHGFSSGLFYAPGRFSEPAEIHALARVAAKHDLVYSTHIRSETDDVIDAVTEAIDVARRTGVRLEISHIKAMGPPNHGKVRRALELMAEARAEGLDVSSDVYPYTASSTSLSSRLPRWALDGGPEALLTRLSDPEQSMRISQELAGRFAAEIDPAGIVIAELPGGPYSPRVGSSLTEIAEQDGSTPQDVALDVLRHHSASVAIVNHAMDQDDLDAALADPHVAIASDGWIMTPTGDGSPHPRSFGTFPRVLGHDVRERGVLGLSEAVRTMTQLPAARAGLHDRGRITEGLVADLVIFDPEAVIDRSTYSDPWQLSEGISHVLVNGEIALLRGEPTSVRAGEVLSRT